MVNHKPDNYDRDYKGPTFLIDCWGSGGYLYEPDATECDQKISLFTCQKSLWVIKGSQT